MKLVFRTFMGDKVWEAWDRDGKIPIPHEGERVRVAEKDWKVLYVTYDYDYSRVYIELQGDVSGNNPGS